MSFQAMAWAVKQNAATPVQKLLLLMLANYADEDGLAWPSKQRLADDCCMSKSTVCDNLARLQDAGLIQITERYHPERGQTSSLIRLTPVRQPDTPLSGSRTPPVREPDTNLSGNLTIAEAMVGRTGKGSRLKEDWTPSPASWARAEKALPPAVLEEELVKFRNYWLARAGREAVKLDWNRTFDNWILTAKQRTPTHAATQRQPAQRQTVRDSLNIVNAAIDTELARYAAARAGEEHGEHHSQLIP